MSYRTMTIKPHGAGPFEAWFGADYVGKRHGPAACPCCSGPNLVHRVRRRSLAGSRLWHVHCPSCDSQILSQSLRELYADDVVYQSFSENPFWKILHQDVYDGGKFVIPIALKRG